MLVSLRPRQLCCTVPDSPEWWKQRMTVGFGMKLNVVFCIQLSCCMWCLKWELEQRNHPAGIGQWFSPSIMMRDHFIPICCGKEEIKACNHLKGLPLGFFLPPLQENRHYSTDGLYLHIGLLPLLHALTIYSLDKGGPQINILNVLSAVYGDKVIKKKKKK